MGVVVDQVNQNVTSWCQGTVVLKVGSGDIRLKLTFRKIDTFGG
jgi:hypothetical protein